MRLTRRRFLASSVVAGVAACSSGSTRAGAAPRSVSYGSNPSQVADLYLPPGDGPHPAVVLVHGGFWKATYDRSLMAPLAVDLVGLGFAVWNIEFRRVGEQGGGWPGTFDDVAAAVDALAGEQAVDAGRVVTCGHSAGGHLALWAAGRARLPSGSPGADPKVRPRAAVSQAGVADLVAGSAARLGGGAVDALLDGSPSKRPERYAVADPAELL
ncbi:MAG: alpha/beta hydrolase, partial [Acidimicrobiales bacterium]